MRNLPPETGEDRSPAAFLRAAPGEINFLRYLHRRKLIRETTDCGLPFFLLFEVVPQKNYNQNV